MECPFLDQGLVSGCESAEVHKAGQTARPSSMILCSAICPIGSSCFVNSPLPGQAKRYAEPNKKRKPMAKSQIAGKRGQLNDPSPNVASNRRQ